MEDHEVREQDLVHPPQGLEGVQLVLARLAAMCATRWRAPRSPDGSARRGLEHAGDGLLREPVDLEAGHRARAARGDRDVAPRVAEADRRRDEQRTLRAASRGARSACRRRRPVTRSAKSRRSRLNLTGCARVRAVAEPSTRRARRRSARRTRRCGRAGSRVLVAVGDERRAADARPSGSTRRRRGRARSPPHGQRPASRASCRAPSRRSPRSAWSSAARGRAAKKNSRKSR